MKLAAVGDVRAIVQHVFELLADPAERRRQAEAGRAFYDRWFDVRHAVAALRIMSLKTAVKRLAHAVGPATGRGGLRRQRARRRSHRLLKEWGSVGSQPAARRRVGKPGAGWALCKELTLSPLPRAEHIGPYLLGVYEAELHETWRQLLQRDYSEFVDVGANFGYYAVGLARRFPNRRVVAFDVDWWARKAVAEMSAANGTSNLSIEAWCDPSWLARHLKDNSLIISDCEGYEGALFCEQMGAGFRHVHVRDRAARGIRAWRDRTMPRHVRRHPRRADRGHALGDAAQGRAQPHSRTRRCGGCRRRRADLSSGWCSRHSPQRLPASDARCSGIVDMRHAGGIESYVEQSFRRCARRARRVVFSREPMGQRIVHASTSAMCRCSVRRPAGLMRRWRRFGVEARRRLPAGPARPAHLRAADRTRAVGDVHSHIFRYVHQRLQDSYASPCHPVREAIRPYVPGALSSRVDAAARVR